VTRRAGAALAESAGVGLAGAALGALAGWPCGIAVPAGVVAGANGALSGWRRVYSADPKGALAFALDSTWALPTTAAGLFAHAVAAARRGGYAPQLSTRRNRHVYAGGFQPRRGFAVTLGNVVSGAGDVTNPRRVKLVTDHEDVHVWQARWLGPLYPAAYAGFAALGAVAGFTAWALRRRGERLGRLVETCAYYLNPLEYWAYSRDGHWPPTGIVPGVGPQKPIVRSFAALGRGQPRK
jgi:hypothetical protein